MLLAMRIMSGLPPMVRKSRMITATLALFLLLATTASSLRLSGRGRKHSNNAKVTATRSLYSADEECILAQESFQRASTAGDKLWQSANQVKGEAIAILQEALSIAESAASMAKKYLNDIADSEILLKDAQRVQVKIAKLNAKQEAFCGTANPVLGDLRCEQIRNQIETKTQTVEHLSFQAKLLEQEAQGILDDSLGLAITAETMAADSESKELQYREMAEDAGKLSQQAVHLQDMANIVCSYSS